jgi:MFS superfamily sulfate permease-like transporter
MKQIFKEYSKSFKNDLPAGIVVFLVAVPLCLGIALASGAPLFSGLIAGMVGGLVVSVISGSHLSVSGPAAGLTVIVLTAINKLGSYEAFLLSVVIAGFMQVIFGIIRAGTVSNFFPTSVIKGMLAAIGIILILKQIPHAFGYDVDYIGDTAFEQSDKENTFSELLKLVNFFEPGAIIISLVSLIILIIWEHPVLKKVNLLPGPLVVVISSILINKFIFPLNDGLTLSANHMVNIPVINSLSEFSGLFSLPDFSQISNRQIYITAATLAIIASLESLLSLEAVDKLDPQKRISPPNRELLAQGIGNMVSGFIGGIPLTAVIVRSSANVNSGAKTKMSAFFHGLFLLGSILMIPETLNMIPLAALAAILLMIGYKLNNVGLYKSMYRAGLDQLIPFLSTIVAIVFTDLLAGIGIGMCVAIFFILMRNMKNNYSITNIKEGKNEPIKLILSEEMSFLNKGSIQETLRKLPAHSNVVIDGTRSKYIDYDVLEVIHDFCENAVHNKIKVQLINIPKNEK